MIRVASLFSGIGGFELGIVQSGINAKIVFSSENDKFAQQIYEKNFGVKPYGDIRQIDEHDIPNHDVLVAGFPCQAFSLAGNRAGFEDTRGTLFFEIARIAECKRPKILLLENVRGLLSHDKGRTFETILKTLDDIGYDAEWQVLNSKNFGVPQNRERVYIIGHLREERGRDIFPIAGKSGQTIVRLNKPAHSGDEIYSENGISSSLNCMHEQHFVAQSVWLGSKFPRARRIKDQCEASHTLVASNSVGVAVNQRVRKLTPIECERLQGFPDDWTSGVSNNQRYKCLGNAVTVSVVEYIMRILMDGYHE